MIKHYALHIISTFLFFMGSPLIAIEPTVVPTVDLSRYHGQWFEIARFPNLFQKNCQKNVSATYRLLETGLIEVINSCDQKNGTITSVTGLARPQTPPSTSKLEVSFFSILGWRPVWGDYWVLYIDQEYQLAVVGDRKQKYGWILARKTAISKDQLATAMAVLNRNGYNSQNLEFTTHD